MVNRLERRDGLRASPLSVRGVRSVNVRNISGINRNCTTPGADREVQAEEDDQGEDDPRPQVVAPRQQPLVHRIHAHSLMELLR